MEIVIFLIIIVSLSRFLLNLKRYQLFDLKIASIASNKYDIILY